MRMLVGFRGDEIRPFSSMIVEGWDKAINPAERCGSKYKKWVQEFTQAERNLLRTWYTKMYHWEMRSGHPLEIVMDLTTYNLIIRAANFFSTV